jgi:hypothetical protein
MKENITKLNRISRKVDLSKFYVITVYPAQINFQGKYDNEIVKFLKKLGFEYCLDNSGITVFTRSNIEVNLT